MLKLSLKFNPSLKLEKIDESKYSTQEELWFSAKNIQLGFSHKISSKEFTEQPDFSEWNYRIGFNYKGFSICSGKLGFGGIISKLNSPAVSSSVYSLGNGGLFTSGITKSSSLCDYCSKPYAVFSNYNASFWRLRNLSVSAFYKSDENYSFCLNCDFVMQRNLSVSFVTAVGSFYIENQNDEWFCFYDYFTGRNFFCMGNQVLLKSRFIDFKTAVNLYENRNAAIDSTCALESKLKFGDFTVNCALFSASSPYIFTSSGRSLKTIFQGKINPEIGLRSSEGKFKLRFGFLYYFEKKIDAGGDLIEITKLASDFELKTRKCISSVSVSSSDVDAHKIKTSFSFGCLNFPFAKVSVSYDFSFGNIDASDNLLNLSFTSRFPFCESVYLNSKFELKHDEAEIKKESFLFGLSFRKKYTKLNLSLASVFKIDV